MKAPGKLLLMLALAGLAGWGLWRLFPGEEKQIRKHLHGLAEAATFTGKEGNLQKLAAVAAVADRFAPDAEVVIEIPGLGARTLNGRSDVREAALAAMSHRGGVKVEFHDLIIQLGPDKRTATADLTARVTAGGERDFGLQELRFVLRKGDSGWRIERLETVQTFR